jgi:hypothetical protein
MNSTITNRRQMMVGTVGMALGALVHSASAEQSPNRFDLNLSPEQLGEIHAETVSYIMNHTDDEDPYTKKGLHRLVALLVSMKLIGDRDAKLLDDVIEVIYKDTNIGAIEDEIRHMFQSAKKDMQDLTRALVSIVLSSIRRAKEFEKDHRRAIFIVAGDFSGGLAGAVGSLKLGPTVAIAGAFFGAVAGSYTAYYASQSNPKPETH